MKVYSNKKIIETLLIASIVFFVSFIIHYPNVASSYYSDIVTIYQRPEVSAHKIPYLEFQFEYPVLSGILVYLGSLSASLQGFYIFISLIIYFSVLASIFFISKILEIYKKAQDRIISFCILSLSFIFFSVYSFDWIGIAFSMGSIYFFLKNSYFKSAAFLSLAIATRLIPIIMLPIFLLALKDKKKIAGFILTVSLVWLFVNSYFMVANFPGWIKTYSFQFDWGIENSWMIYIFPRLGKESHYATAFLLILFTGILIKKKLYKNFLGAMFFMFLAFMISSYKVPPQYFLMLLPFFVLTENTGKTLFYLTDFLNTLIIFLFFTSFFAGADALEASSPVQFISAVRQFLFLIILYGLIKVR